MKKIAILGATALLVGCHTAQKVEPNVEPADNMTILENYQSAEIAGVPCSYSCMPDNPCIQTPEPMILKPRVRETLGYPRKRPCCDDEPMFGEPLTYVPDAPEIYVISANRTVNSMLKEATAFYEQVGTMKVYINNTDIKSSDLPGGVEQGAKTLRKRFSGISNVIVTKTPKEAEYIIDSSVDWYDTATKVVPAIKYDLFLKDKSGRLIGEWSEIIHQAEGDRSWW